MSNYVLDVFGRGADLVAQHYHLVANVLLVEETSAAVCFVVPGVPRLHQHVHGGLLDEPQVDLVELHLRMLVLADAHRVDKKTN